MTPAPDDGVAVLGVGNLIHSDDGLGIHALRKLQRDPRVPRGVTLLDGGTFGLELIAYVHEAGRILLLDAVDVGAAPGTLVRLEGDTLRGLPGGASVHQLGVADLLAALPLASEREREIVLLGVQPAATDWGTELTPEVEAAVGSVVEEAIAQLERWRQAPAMGAASSCA